jgi:hypothetical protein
MTEFGIIVAIIATIAFIVVKNIPSRKTLD